MTLAYATHRLSGVASPANAAYSAPELEFQLKNSGAKALFTVSQLHLKVLADELIVQLVCPSFGNCSASSEILRDPKSSSLYPGVAKGVLCR